MFGLLDSGRQALDAAILMDDDDRPRRQSPEHGLGAASLLAGESLDSYSLDELDLRVGLLKAEIARIESHRDQASRHMRAAQDLFRRKPA